MREEKRYPLADMEENKRYFGEIADLLLSREKETNGFGTLQEKTIHEVIKDFYCYDHDFQEQKRGRYIADIAIDDDIWEIQTRAFNKLRGKLAAFLKEYHVTVIYPVPVEKKIYWLNQETGAITGGRRSPRRGNAYDIFWELYKIRPYLTNENLAFHIFLMDMEEYKLLDVQKSDGRRRGRQKKGTRYDRLPGRLWDIVRLECKADYLYFLPDSLPDEFTSLDLAKYAHIARDTAQTCLLILYDLEIVERIGKQGRSYLYRILI